MPAHGPLQPAFRAAYESSAVRRLAPFVGVALVGTAVAVAALGVEASGLWVALGLGLSALVMILVTPWRRLPSWAGAIPALVFLAGVGFLRDAAGGPVAGVSPLVLLPALWLGLYGNRRQLAIVIPAVGAAFLVPIVLIGGHKYPASQWHAGVMYVALSLLIGPNVQRLIRQVKQQAAEAKRQQREIATVARVARRLSTGEGTRRDVCAAASAIGGSLFAVLWEPTANGRFVASASAGVDLPKEKIDPTEERSGVLTVFRTAAPLFVPDPAANPAVGARVLELLPESGSVLFQPVMSRGEPVGVLVLGWSERVDDEDRLATMVGLLAAEAGIAIERADLMTTLEELADTDELTGLPNRRGWNRELEIALSHAQRRRSPLCVALIDVDRFKELNDARGHQAGDRLLKSAAAAWRSTLRPPDVLARPGGDEFALVLPDCDLERAGTVLTRLRSATPSESTCSIGVAQWDGAEAAERLVARADDALYAAKEGGRDRVVAAGPA
jgi:diguanylate cyclase (GGDEF)-like protein